MPNNNNNLIPKESIAKVEEIREIKNEFPSLEEFLKNYEVNKGVVDSYNSEVEDYNGVGQGKACGPMHRGGSSSSSHFTIRYFFSHGGGNEKLFFERHGVYSTELSISGDLWKLRGELRKLENGEIRVFNLVERRYERDWDEEEDIKESLREDIRRCEEQVRNLGPNRGCSLEMSQTFSKIV